MIVYCSLSRYTISDKDNKVYEVYDHKFEIKKKLSEVKLHQLFPDFAHVISTSTDILPSEEGDN